MVYDDRIIKIEVKTTGSKACYAGFDLSQNLSDEKKILRRVIIRDDDCKYHIITE